jgi:hypothetical protein
MIDRTRIHIDKVFIGSKEYAITKNKGTGVIHKEEDNNQKGVYQ